MWLVARGAMRQFFTPTVSGPYRRLTSQVWPAGVKPAFSLSPYGAATISLVRPVARQMFAISSHMSSLSPANALRLRRPARLFTQLAAVLRSPQTSCYIASLIYLSKESSAPSNPILSIPAKPIRCPAKFFLG